MTTSPDQLDHWRRAVSENQCLEFKEAKSQFDSRRLAKYCVAIANEGGGRLILGVTDKPPRVIVGTSAFSDIVDAAEKLFHSVHFRVDIEEVNHPDGRVIIFHIPSRPSGTAYHLSGEYLMRSGEALVPMTEDRLRTIFAEGEPSWLDEPSRAGLDAQEVIELLDTQKYFELLKIPYPTDRNGVLDRLISERLVETADETYTIRRLGALLLAKRLSLFPDVSRKAPRVIVYSGSSKVDPRSEQTGEYGYAVSFQGLVRFVMEKLPQNELIEDALRTQVKAIPNVVIRELIANALIHQDFKMGGASVIIEVYNDRVEITNPGEPLVPVERFIDGYQSRNERLASIMRRFGICEERSSGIDRVVQSVELYQLPAPDFKADLKRTSVKVFCPRPFEEMDRNDRVRACYQHCVLKWVASEKMTNQSLRERFRLTEDKASIASQVISATIDANMIRLDESVGGSRKFARYIPFWA